MPDRKRPTGKLSVSASNAVNSLLHYIGVTERPEKHPGPRDPVPPARARDAAVLLADLAHNGLYAGLDGKDVERSWPQVVAHRRPGPCGKQLTGGTCGRPTGHPGRCSVFPASTDKASPPAPAALDPEVCGARHPTRPDVRCQESMTAHPLTWHEARGPSDGERTASFVWAVDAVRPPVRPGPAVPDQLGAGQRPRTRRGY